MKIRIPLLAKIATPVIVLIGLTIGISVYQVYGESQQRWQSEVDSRLERVAWLVADDLDVEVLQEIRRPVDVESVAYQQVWDALDAAVRAGNLDWIGIYRYEEGYLYYWVDWSDTGVGYPFFYPTPAHFAALEDGHSHQVQYTDEFGSYYGFVAPIVIEDGDGERTLGLVEAVLEQESAQLVQQSTLRKVWLTLALGVLMTGAVVTLVTALVFDRPLRRLKRGALTLAQGDLGHTIRLNSHDELSDLADAFNQMSSRLAQLYGELEDHNTLLEERVEARTAELLAERNRLKIILQTMVDGLVVTDTHGNIVMANNAFAQIVQSGPEHLTGSALERVFPSRELAALVEQALLHPGEDFVFTLLSPLPGTRPALTPVYKATACALLPRPAHRDEPANGAGEILGVVTVLHDVTHETEVDRMKTEFISAVSHELRTPLTSVLGFAKLIGRSFDRDVVPCIVDGGSRGRQMIQRIRENLDIIVSEAERLTRLINDVLDIAQMEAGKVEWHMGNVAVAEVIRNSLATVSALADSKELDVKVIIPEDLPLVRADSDRIAQVIINLLSNAIKFTDVGGITVRVVPVSVAADGTVVPDLGVGSRTLAPGDWLAVSVQDTGIGIPADKLTEVFQKFKQLGDLMTNRPKGTGLGLAICKEIVEYHGGQIWVESMPAVGSTFTFVLPVSTAPARPVATGELRRRVAETLPVGEGGRLILIVDDDASIRKLLRLELSTAGYAVRDAADGLEALACVRSQLPALIILDLMLPGISGLDVLRVLKGDPATAPVPVLILSVLEDREQGLRLGADEYLIKPLDHKRLLGTIADLLERAERGEGRRKVLLIDDDQSVIDPVSELLRARGYEVVRAGDGASGLKQARAERPDLIILDAGISKLDDYRLLKALKTDVRTREACVIVMTATATPQEIAEFVGQGAGYCSGPEALPDLLPER